MSLQNLIKENIAKETNLRKTYEHKNKNSWQKLTALKITTHPQRQLTNTYCPGSPLTNTYQLQQKTIDFKLMLTTKMHITINTLNWKETQKQIDNPYWYNHYCCKPITIPIR